MKPDEDGFLSEAARDRFLVAIADYLLYHKDVDRGDLVEEQLAQALEQARAHVRGGDGDPTQPVPRLPNGLYELD